MNLSFQKKKEKRRGKTVVTVCVTVKINRIFKFTTFETNVKLINIRKILIFSIFYLGELLFDSNEFIAIKKKKKRTSK